MSNQGTSVAIDEIRDRLASADGRLYEEFLRVPDLSVGLYKLAAGAEDPQTPHREDEVYYVLHGSARIRIGDAEYPARAGDVIYVPKLEPHRFVDITEDLEVLVFFAPAES